MAKKAFRFYDNKGTGNVFDLPTLKPGGVLADAFNALTTGVKANSVAASDVWQQTPFGVITNKPDPPDSPPAWFVYGSQKTATVKASHFGDLIIGPNADDTLTVTKRMDLDVCNDTNTFDVVADDIIYIDVTVTPTTLVAASAEVKKIAKASGWTDYPALASFNGSDQQTNAYIPLAHVQDVSADNWASVEYEGDFTLLPGCLGLYQLVTAHITLELSTYLAKAALLPNPLPSAIK
ncbi:hypothetical protein N9937_01785 [bacterium]|nr:hypothetical protein [bacterium]